MSSRKRSADDAEQKAAIPIYENWAKLHFTDDSKAFFKQFPQVGAESLRTTKKRKMEGSCVRHPVENGFLKFSEDDSIKNDEVVRKFTFKSTSDLNERIVQFTSVPHGVYNFILFTNSDNTVFILHMVYMNPGEYHNKHKDLIFESSTEITGPNFMYSGEIKFDGSPEIVVNDISSLYFFHIKNDSITLAFQLLFPNMTAFINAMEEPGLQYYKSLKFKTGETIGKKALIMHFNRFYTMADGTEANDNQDRWLQKGIREQIDIILQKMFTEFMQYSLRMMFGDELHVKYSKNIYKGSAQEALNRNFMNILCRAKTNPSDYPPLYSDQDCSVQVIGKTWCTYTNK